MNDDQFYITTLITEESRVRPSAVLKSDGTPFELERKKEPIGFVLKPT